MARRVVVLGSLNQDLVITVARLPHPGETVMGQGPGYYPGGKGANQAVAAARLGGQVALVGRVGNDSFGGALIKTLQVNGVDTSGVELDPKMPTGTALIFVEEGGQNMIAVGPGANASLGAADVERAVARLRPGDLLVMQLEIPVAVVERAILDGGRAGAVIVLNAAPARRLEPALLSRLDVLVVNDREADVLADHGNSPEDAAAALRLMGPRMAIITLGPAGSVFCDQTGVHRVEPFVVNSIDSTGAGDAFMGALAVALAAGLTTELALRFASAAGAAATTELGAQAALPRLDDLRRLFDLDLSSFAEA